jgi:hypothetical protein
MCPSSEQWSPEWPFVLLGAGIVDRQVRTQPFQVSCFFLPSQDSSADQERNPVVRSKLSVPSITNSMENQTTTRHTSALLFSITF